ncbi:MAG: SDR family NAD(P)-dependent oxidoreductase [Bradymonadaceae bacterium]
MIVSAPPVVLLTGASTGLGLVLARELIARNDYRLILTARRESLPRFAELGIVEDSRIRLRALDVTNSMERLAVIEEANEDWNGVDILINNAGVSIRSVVEHVSEEDRMAQMDVNFRSPMELIRLVLPRMRHKREGRIINISSVGGMMAMPTMAVYSASKFALEGATEALWYEVRPWNIKVTLVEPGFINSKGFEKVRFTEQSAQANDMALRDYHEHYRHMDRFIEKMMTRTGADPKNVARVILRTMTRKRPALRVTATLDAWLFSMVRRFLPRRFYHWLLYRSLPSIAEWGRPRLPGPKG